MSALFWKKLLIRTRLARYLPSVKRKLDGGGSFLHYYSDRTLSAAVDELKHIRDALDTHQPDGIDLSMGAPRFDVAPLPMHKLPAERRGYPASEGLLELRMSIAQLLAKRDQITFQPEHEVHVTHGGTGAFNLAMDAFVNPGDRVVLFAPTSPLFYCSLRQRQANICWVQSNLEKGQMRFSWDQLSRYMKRAKMIVIADPNNPNGGVFALEDLERIAALANRYDTLIYNDQAFGIYRYGKDVAAGNVLQRAEKQTLHAGTLTKSYGLAAAPVGWLAGNRFLVGACAVAAAVQAPFVPTTCQLQALTALQTSPERLDAIQKDFRSRKDYVGSRLEAMGLGCGKPQGGFFYWVPVEHFGLNGRQFARQLLREKNVLVLPGDLFGPEGTQHIRISFAIDEGRLTEGLRRIADYLGGGSKHQALSPPHLFGRRIPGKGRSIPSKVA